MGLYFKGNVEDESCKAIHAICIAKCHTKGNILLAVLMQFLSKDYIGMSVS